jgi:hypothetical protein
VKSAAPTLNPSSVNLPAINHIKKGKMNLADFPTVRGCVSEAKRQTRVDFAACYRLIALYGWSDLVLAWPALLRKLDRIDPSYKN